MFRAAVLLQPHDIYLVATTRCIYNTPISDEHYPSVWYFLLEISEIEAKLMSNLIGTSKSDARVIDHLSNWVRGDLIEISINTFGS